MDDIVLHSPPSSANEISMCVFLLGFLNAAVYTVCWNFFCYKLISAVHWLFCKNTPSIDSMITVVMMSYTEMFTSSTKIAYILQHWLVKLNLLLQNSVEQWFPKLLSLCFFLRATYLSLGVLFFKYFQWCITSSFVQSLVTWVKKFYPIWIPPCWAWKHFTSMARKIRKWHTAGFF